MPTLTPANLLTLENKRVYKEHRVRKVVGVKVRSFRKVLGPLGPKGGSGASGGANLSILITESKAMLGPKGIYTQRPI